MLCEAHVYQSGGGRHLSTASCNWWGQSKWKCRKPHSVLFLALAYIPRLGANQCMLIGHEKSRELIVLKPIYDALGCPLASALIEFHSFTGCDIAGRFSGKGKVTCWKSLKKADKTTVQGFIDLGQADIPSEATISALERYICQLYLPGTSQNMASGWHRESHTCVSDRTWMDKRGGLSFSCENITKTSSRCCDWVNTWQMCEI